MLFYSWCVTQSEKKLRSAPFSFIQCGVREEWLHTASQGKKAAAAHFSNFSGHTPITDVTAGVLDRKRKSMGVFKVCFKWLQGAQTAATAFTCFSKVSFKLNYSEKSRAQKVNSSALRRFQVHTTYHWPKFSEDTHFVYCLNTDAFDCTKLYLADFQMANANTGKQKHSSAINKSVWFSFTSLSPAALYRDRTA